MGLIQRVVGGMHNTLREDLPEGTIELLADRSISFKPRTPQGWGDYVVRDLDLPKYRREKEIYEAVEKNS